MVPLFIVNHASVVAGAIVSMRCLIALMVRSMNDFITITPPGIQSSIYKNISGHKKVHVMFAYSVCVAFLAMIDVLS